EWPRVSANWVCVVALDQIGKARCKRLAPLPSPLVGEGGAKLRMRVLFPRRELLIRLAAASRQRSTFSHRGRRSNVVLLAKLLRGPRIKAGRGRLFGTAAFWRDVQPKDFGIGEQVRKIHRLEEHFMVRRKR